MALLHETHCFVAAIVRHCGSLMENATDAVACVGAHDGVALWLYCICDDVSDLSIHLVWPTVLDRLHQTFVCFLDKGNARLCHLTNEVCFIQVTMVPIVVSCHVQIDDISVLYWPRIGDTVTNDLVY